MLCPRRAKTELQVALKSSPLEQAVKVCCSDMERRDQIWTIAASFFFLLVKDEPELTEPHVRTGNLLSTFPFARPEA